MEVYLLAGLVVGILIYVTHLHSQNKSLREETESLGEALSSTLIDQERALDDQQLSERELAIIKARLEGLEKSSLTPENSVPKNMHVEKVLELANKLGSTEMLLQDVTKKFEESRGKQISSRVKMGQIGEQFVFFNKEFKYDRKETKSLLQPIDLICFEDKEVVFVEVKTGESQLSSKQRRIRDNIQSGRVRFEVLRIDENGFHWSDK